MAITKFALTLQERRKLTGSVIEFVFTSSSALAFKAGQFISLHIEQEGKEQRRNYSITNSPSDQDTLGIAVSYVPGGLASTLLWELKPGESVNASGPYGIFVLDANAPKRYILMGTGTGIAPYRSMLPDLKFLLEHNPTHEVVVIEGVRTKDDLLYAQDFCALAAQLPNFKFMACYSKLQESLESFERHGYLQHHLAELNLNVANDLPYLCGNPQMVDDVFNLLQTEYGFDKRAIKREKYVTGR